MARTFLTECRAPQEAVDKAEDLRLPQLQGAIQDARPPVDTRLPGIPGREGSGESPKLDAWGDKKKRINLLIERIRQPLKTLNVRPTLEQLEKDWQALQTVHSEFS